MPRPLRIEYPGAIYHLLNRGDRREPIFIDDGDRHDFLKTLGEACQKTGFEVHAFCLMRNHFHLVVETPRGNLVAGMRWFLSTYSNRFNHRHKLIGHVFSGRYKALLVEGSGNGYLKTVCDYVHLNPARAGLLRSSSRLLEFPWSSFPLYLTETKHRPPWLRVDRFLGEHGLASDNAAARRHLEERLETRRHEEGDPRQWKGLSRGWCIGSEEFKRRNQERMSGLAGPHHSGAIRREAEQAKAQEILARELKALRWKEGDLTGRRKTDPQKVRLAIKLRQETTLTVDEIAHRLHMGTRQTLNTELKRWKQKNP